MRVVEEKIVIWYPIKVGKRLQALLKFINVLRSPRIVNTCPDLYHINSPRVQTGVLTLVPSGKLLQFAIENDHFKWIYPWNMVISHSKLLLYQRVTWGSSGNLSCQAEDVLRAREAVTCRGVPGPWFVGMMNDYMGISQNGGTPNWLVYEDDFGVPLF